MANRVALSLYTRRKFLVYEGKVYKHEAKLNVSNVFLSVSRLILIYPAAESEVKVVYKEPLVVDEH